MRPSGLMSRRPHAARFRVCLITRPDQHTHGIGSLDRPASPFSTPSLAHRATKSYSWNEVTCGTQSVSTKLRWAGCALYASYAA